MTGEVDWDAAWRAFLDEHTQLVGWCHHGEVFTPALGTPRDIEMMRRASEHLGLPMPEPVYGWKRSP
ncbi:hypothetical protein [Amycolatopsis kentuckyensis]|uniref:hypothetical protein n=1 Tax=Amycolatopsis kentuckyensis TaxID=218823 RepID=UPI000A36D95E|nr:hypothetical protein [Amycolatopsis kentuckyensis]